MLLVHAAVVSGTQVTFGPLALRVLDLTLLRAGLWLAPAVVIGVVALFVAGRRSRHGGRLTEVAVLYVVGAIGLGGLAVASGPAWFALAAVPTAVSIAGTNPILNAGLLDTARAGTAPGRALGWLLLAQGAGGVAGPVVAGGVIELSGVRAAVGAMAMGMALLVLLAAWGARWVRL